MPTVPAVRKDAYTLPSLQAKKPKNLLLEHVWMVWGVWGDAEKSYGSVYVKFGLFDREKNQETTKMIFEFLTLLTRHRFFLLSPKTLNPIFWENTKRRAPKNDRDLSYQK